MSSTAAIDGTTSAADADSSSSPPIDWYKYIGVSHFFLYVEAFIIWVAGVLACAEISSNLFLDVYRTNNSGPYFIWGLVLGAILGLAQAKFIFIRVCKRNLDRILNLEKPLFFNCFRIYFYVFFGTFDTTMVIVSNQYVKTTIAKTVVGALDMSVAIGLTISLYTFLENWKAFMRKSSGGNNLDLIDDSKVTQHNEPLLDRPIV